MKTRRLLFAVLALVPVTLLGQQPPPPLDAKVDAIFARMNSTASPGCALAVMREGQVVYSRGYGMANLDHDVVITPSTVFHVASVSKQFTAAAVLLLAQDGRLTLDDNVRKYVPELPDFGVPITIRHLLHHTSGLRDQWDLLGIAGWRYSLDLITDNDVLEMMARQKDLNFRPGERFLYCNTGYTLLATIVARASGKSFRAFTDERIFKPLGMTRTHFRDDHAEIIKGQAYGYAPSRNTFRLSVTNFDTAGATSLHTTAEDMARWDRNFYDPSVGGSALVEQLTTRGVLNNGERLPYASGLGHGTYRGLATISHSGGDAGYRAEFLRFPTEKLSIACLCNVSAANPSAMARQVADVYLADRLGPADGPPPLPPSIKVDEQQLARVAGVYWNREQDAFRRFLVRNGTLLLGFDAPGSELASIAADRFAIPPVEFSFEMPAKGRAVRVIETPRAAGGKPTVYVAAQPFAPSPVDLAEYAGVYRSEEVELAYRLVVEKDKLVLRRLKLDPTRLDPLVRDTFSVPMGTIRFVRDARGRVSGLTLSTGRALNLRFSRQLETT